MSLLADCFFTASGTLTVSANVKDQIVEDKSEAKEGSKFCAMTFWNSGSYQVSKVG